MVQLNPVPFFGSKKKIPVPFDGEEAETERACKQLFTKT